MIVDLFVQLQMENGKEIQFREDETQFNLISRG